ncbi:citrate synthase/methylcitrate synthase [Rossellomorea marisflavi]|uniref:citrate synthase/methylcitrate synthase n=1 Tax=Rossellomorea marisflavi TaxID=189381 RepID=UPI001317A4D5|nr:citrate synthase/methylcitrate synthase [Rossellomorea marisflavi]MCM2603920.1 citrate synthase/methylcitrate synthase [Rossellomorea marisflavi]QHA36354.1 citrate synthase/methylcitrate synthase [Rossellomorea marisflavi]
MYQPGLKGIVAAQTAISHIDGEKGILIYRGHDVRTLTGKCSFEQAAFLLWYGRLPSKEEGEHMVEELKNNRTLSEAMLDVLTRLPENMDRMSVLRTVLSAEGGSEYGWKPTLNQAVRITALIPTIIAYRERHLKELDFIEPHEELGHVSNYLYMLTGAEPDRAVSQALETYMILTMEHGMNASTFSARVTASTESDLISSVISAIGTMKGPLHGGAPTGVIALLEEIGREENGENVIREKISQGEKLMGFGHRIYKTRDPRATALKGKLLEFRGENKELDLAIAIEEIAVKLLEELKPGRGLYTNVEYYAASIMRAINLPDHLFTPTFTAARAVGWTAHVLEQSEDNTIFRPQSHYIGSLAEPI